MVSPDFDPSLDSDFDLDDLDGGWGCNEVVRGGARIVLERSSCAATSELLLLLEIESGVDRECGVIGGVEVGTSAGEREGPGESVVPELSSGCCGSEGDKEEVDAGSEGNAGRSSSCASWERRKKEGDDCERREVEGSWVSGKRDSWRSSWSPCGGGGVSKREPNSTMTNGISGYDWTC